MTRNEPGRGQGTRSPTSSSWSSRPAPPTNPLVERLAEEMAQRWQKGEQPLTEEYLALYPELGNQPTAAVELIYEELCLRQEAGQEVNAAEVLRRFPHWRQQLQVVLDCHQLLGAEPGAPRFPAVEEALGDFRLLAELGRGGQGRVFLARQISLADRLVVLKLIPRGSREHLSLARLAIRHQRRHVAG